MKKSILFAASFATLALVMTACGGATEASEKVTYELDAKATQLMWKGDYADGTHSHNGTVNVTEGMIAFTGEEFEKGAFKIDLATIKSELTPETGATDLMGHLSSPDFFDAAQFPKVDVTINSISDSEITATIKIAGKELAAKMPLKIKKTASQFTAKGKFIVDVTSLDLAGFKPNAEKEKEKKDQFVNPNINFELNLVLNAAKE